MSTAPHRDVAAVASGVKPAFVASADLDVVLSAIAERVAEAVGVWGCDVYEYREESDTLVATALWAQEITDRDREWLGTSCTLAERPSYGPVIRERALLECHLGDPDLCAAEAELMRRWGARSALTMPLVFQEEAVGAITVVETREARRFSSEDLQVLELMAVPAAVALQNARMFRREAEQNRRLQALFSASRAIASTIHLEESLGVITGAARQALDAAECVINTLDPLAGTLTTVAHQRRDARSGRAREIGTAYPLADVPADRDVLPKGAIVEECVSDPAIDARSRRWMIDTGEKARLIVP
ncbi:MAG: GAF domain-containing protein, partial [Thermoleophilia bacterium]